MAETKLDLVTRYNHERNLAITRWENHVILPFAQAYNRAYDKFYKTLDSQAKADNAKVELLFVGLSIVGGSALTAMFGKAALRVALKDMAVSVICNQRMERTFKLAGMIESNPVASFALGELVDASTKALTDQVKKSLKAPLPADAVAGASSNGLDVFISMKRVLGNANEKAQMAALDILENKTTVDQAKLALAALRRAPIMNAPKQDLYDGRLADALELTMYLNLVLTRDRLIRYAGNGPHARRKLRRMQISSTPIRQIPGAGDYPKAKTPAEGDYYYSSEISISALGGDIDDRVNELHRKFFGTKLVAGSFFSSLTYENMKTAVHSLRSLTTRYRRPEMLYAA